MEGNMTLFEVFPYLTDDIIIIKKMEECDVQELQEITDNPNVYRYIPYFLYKKSKGNLLAAIRNCGGRDFEKKKYIICGIYLGSAPQKLIGLAEMFDYSKRRKSMTIGYKINEKYWNQGLASRAIALMKEYLIVEQGLLSLHAYVMPDNIFSEKALLSNGFKKSVEQVEQKNWAGMSVVTTNHYVLNQE